MSERDKIAVINEGKEANYLEGKLRPILEEMEYRLVADIKSSFRSGNKDGIEMGVRIGTLCAMDDLRNHLFQKIAQSKSVEKENHESPGPSGAPISAEEYNRQYERYINED